MSTFQRSRDKDIACPKKQLPFVVVPSRGPLMLGSRQPSSTVDATLTHSTSDAEAKVKRFRLGHPQTMREVTCGQVMEALLDIKVKGMASQGLNTPPPTQHNNMASIHQEVSTANTTRKFLLKSAPSNSHTFTLTIPPNTASPMAATRKPRTMTATKRIYGRHHSSAPLSHPHLAPPSLGAVKLHKTCPITDSTILQGRQLFSGGYV